MCIFLACVCEAQLCLCFIIIIIVMIIIIIIIIIKLAIRLDQICFKRLDQIGTDLFWNELVQQNH